MRKKQIISLAVLSVVVLIPALFNSCAADHGSGSLNSSSGGSVCENILVNEFREGYWPFVRSNDSCMACHNTGPGSGLFANSDLSTAYHAFADKTEERIAQFATTAHKPPYTGAQHNTAVTALRSSWSQAMGEYQSCVSSGGGGTPGPGGPQLVVPSKFTIAKSFTASTPNTPVTMTWNTGTEMMNAGDAYVGGSISMVMNPFDAGGGVTGYELRTPRLVNTGASAAYVKGIAVKINGTLVAGGSTWYTLERYVPNLANNNSRQLPYGVGGAIIYIGPINAAVNVQIGFTDIRAAGIDFQPTIFTTLNTANTGIFAVNCQACHAAQGQFPTQTYNRVVGAVGNSGATLVVKFRPDLSELYRRVTSAASPMPQTGLLPQATQDRIRDWILDGAPNTNNDILR